MSVFDHFWDTSVEIPPITLVLMVCKFLKVFFDDLHGMSLDRDINFFIDFKLGTHPIFVSSYRMALVELRALKV